MSLSPPPSPLALFSMSSAPASTAASSPPPSDADWQQDSTSPPKPIPIEEEDMEARFARLNWLLQKSAVYANILKEQMDSKKGALHGLASSSESSNRTTRRPAPKRSCGRKRLRLESDESSDDESSSKRKKLQDGLSQPQDDGSNGAKLQQPGLVTGAKLKDYQLEGVEWMISLDQNGISGILADEMGLGKTLQTIAFNAYLRERKNFRPFLVVCPLSVLHNWIEEFAKFAPAIPVCMYHGTPAERAELRRTVMRLPNHEAAKIVRPVGDVDMDGTISSKQVSGNKGAPKAPTKKTNTNSRRRISKRATIPPTKGKRHARLFNAVDEEDEEDEKADVQSDAEPFDQGDDAPKPEDDDMEDAARFPVVVTTYEMIIKDRVHLSAYDFSYIVVDEGHRLKNLDCKLMQEIKKYKSAGRMILTGTPLHNNLAELWSLLNFILPDIFTDVDSFQRWFNLPTMQENLSSSHSSQIIHSLHAILKPFLLRRLKADVEVDLPPKKEYVLYAPLSERQRKLYDHVLAGGLREFLIGRAGLSKQSSTPTTKDGEQSDSPRKLRSQKAGYKRKDYTYNDDDDDNFETPELDNSGHREAPKNTEEIGREYQHKAMLKQVNNMRLQNTVMQLRKVCSHPFLFNWPVDPDTRQPILNEELVDASGKMMMLDRLLGELFKRGHKVLLFTQFTTMLDIIEDWAIEFKGWNICRIDGSTPPLERREQMYQFQNGGDAPNAPRLFLLSTRAGGLGINLVAADTVIFYDQDWNPQMDAQAQDRAHRIGQTKPVLIFRLVSAHTIETKIMQRATEKRKLEALVIAKGKFKMPASVQGRGKPETIAEMAATLLKLESEKIEVVPNTKAGKASVLSDEDLDMLLDRSPEIFADRGQGWTSVDKTLGETKTGKKTAFAVYEAPVDAGNTALAKMFGEDVD